MKGTKALIALATTLVLAACSAGTTGDAVIDPGSDPSPQITEPQTDASDGATPSAETMSSEEIVLEALMGPDGEYAAAASYLAVLEKFGSEVQPYARIYEAELRHIDALIRQLERIGADVPENPYLGEIAAPDNLQEAAEAWAEGEILNVELYDKLLVQTDDENLIRVLNNLRRASLEQHLPAFEAAAANGGTLDN